MPLYGIMIGFLIGLGLMGLGMVLLNAVDRWTDGKK